ncbi:hypothetical protein AB1Y20_007615 [Prymnesium parvum]|uniref:Pectin acetylesterase n=1 Tax=Prymnesium parvum TaxID=97485 RepID=A0AB34IXH1_PRYPA
MRASSPRLPSPLLPPHLLLLLLLPPPASPLTLTRHSLAAYPAAICSDGSPASYYFLASPRPSSLWLVHLQGGGWCWDASSCAARCGGGGYPLLCSSARWEETYTAGGIFDAPALAEASKAFVRYCTSDAHMGNGSAFGLQFRGAAVVRAVLSSLVSRHGLAEGALVLFGGDSAGGRGAMVHLDGVAARLAAALRRPPAAVRVRGMIDSAMWLDLLPAKGAAFPGFARVTKLVHANAAVDVGADCAVRFPGEEWRCMFGEDRLPLLATPYFAIGSQHDSYQLSNDLPAGWQSRSEYYAYLAAFSARTVELCLRIVNSTTRRAAYSSRCLRHAVSTQQQFFEPGCLDLSIEEALVDFLRAADAEEEARPGNNSLYVDLSACRADRPHCSCCPTDWLEWYGEHLVLSGTLLALVALSLFVGASCCCWRYCGGVSRWGKSRSSYAPRAKRRLSSFAWYARKLRRGEGGTPLTRSSGLGDSLSARELESNLQLTTGEILRVAPPL